MAGGCYSLQSAATGRFVTRAEGGPAATSGKGQAEPFRFQATDLGRYLLFGTGRNFLAASTGDVAKTTGPVANSSASGAANGATVGTVGTVRRGVTEGPAGAATGRGGSIVLAGGPHKLADWRVTRAPGGGFRFALPALDRVLVAAAEGTLEMVAPDEARGADRFRLERAGGCKRYPEIKVNVEGPVAGGKTPYGQVRGYIDAHLHAMAFEFLGGRARCGRPWHRYGAAFALRGCKEHEIAGGRAAVLENVLSNRDMVKGHDTNAGWPTFTDWPKHGSLTYEQVYYKWLERAWRGGLRSYVNLLVDNNQLCKIYPYKRHGCNEMEGVRLQYRRVHQLQRYIDAQHGGPGKGWFRIVDDPFEARRVMNAGKLAVILGIEVSVLFDCGVRLGQPACTTEEIDQRLDEVYDMGIRQMELVNKFDNALSGVTGDNAAVGVLVNGANFLETGQFWPMRTCEDPDTHAHDKHQHNIHDDSGAPEQMTGRDSLVGILLQEIGGSGAAPAYGPGPHCSDLGLSPLGAHLIKRMMDKGMIFDPDHMSATARDQAMDIVEQREYSGVISSHSWADDTIYPRIWALGGVVTPHAGTSASFVEKWRQQKAWADDRHLFGLGFGSDMNGFSNQGGPRGADAPRPVRYPFTGFGGTTVHQQVSGKRTYDYNTDGVAHYGLYTDFVEDVRRLGGDKVVADMRRGPEAYLQMWERAAGVAATSCSPEQAQLAQAQANLLRAGMSPEEVLITLGQPVRRAGNTFVYCAILVVFDDEGRLAGIERTEQAQPAQQQAAASGTSGKGGKSTVDAAAKPAKSSDRVARAAGPSGGKAAPAHNHADHRHGPLNAVATASEGEAARPLVLLVFLTLLLAIVFRRRSSS
jgi:hypothetical protein